MISVIQKKKKKKTYKDPHKFEYHIKIPEYYNVVHVIEWYSWISQVKIHSGQTIFSETQSLVYEIE